MFSLQFQVVLYLYSADPHGTSDPDSVARPRPRGVSRPHGITKHILRNH